MNWYLVIKLLHILAAALTIGSIFSRQMVRGTAKRSNDIKEVAHLTRVAIRMDRKLVIPASNVMVLMGIGLAVKQKWPLLGSFQGATQNWLLVSNVLFIIMMGLIFVIVVPHNKRVEAKLNAALAEGHLTSKLMAELEDNANKFAHRMEEIIMLMVAALMIMKPF